MATIYLPDDKRDKMISLALEKGGDAFMRQQDASKRAAAMQQMFQGGQTDPFALATIAAGNPESEAMLKSIWGQQQAQVLSGLHQAETQRTQAETLAIPMKMQQTAAQIALERAQATLAEKHGALADAQAALTKFTANKDVAQAQEAQMRVQQIQKDIAVQGTVQELLKGQLQSYTDMQSGLPGTGTATPSDLQGGGTITPSAAPGFKPVASTSQVGQGPGRLQPPPMKPTPDSGLPPDYDLNADPTSKAINRMEKANAVALPPGMRVSAGKMSMSTPTLPPAVQQRVSTVQAFQQTIAELQQRIGVDEQGKLKMGPLSGRFQKAINAFKKDPQDPNVIMESLFGHEIANQFALMPQTRAGFNMTNLISGIIADMAHGKGEALAKLKQSARIVRPEIGTLAQEMAGKSGGNPDAIHEMDQLNKQMLTYDYKDPYGSVDDVSRLGFGITEDDINHTLQLHPEFKRSDVIKLYADHFNKGRKDAKGSSGGDSDGSFSGE